MIPTKHYIDAGSTLKRGQQVNLCHTECKAGVDTRSRLYVKRKDDDTIVAYCHNCGDYGVHSQHGRIKAIQELLAEARYVKTNGAGELLLPGDVEKDPDRWPVEAAAWVYKYGIDVREIFEHEICYSPSWDRVILPVYEDGKLVFWQGRAVRKGQDPKYVSVKAHPRVMAWCNTARAAAPEAVFVVEDRLSGIKLGRYADTVALLGTSPDIDCLTEALANYNKVGICLDPDRAGEQKSRELQARLSLVFRGTVRNYALPQQPKEMDDIALAALAVLP